MYVSRFIGRSLLAGLAISAVAVPAIASGAAAAGSGGDVRAFTSHATAYAAHHHASAALDPDVFVADSEAAAGDGPEHIRHAAGFRPARSNDDPGASLFSANGTPLNISVGRWFAARGDARVNSDADGDRLAVRFSHLLPFGSYSLFAMRRSDGDSRFEALKSDGGSPMLTASPDGDARATVIIPSDAQNADIALVMHSDDSEHDNSPGDLGVNAHVQLVLAQTAANDAYADPAADETQSPMPAATTDDDFLPPPDDAAPTRTAPPAPRATPDDADADADANTQGSDQSDHSDDEHDAPPTDDGDQSDQAPI